MPDDMTYTGTKLIWYGHGQFNATSGLPNHQLASEQAHSDEDHGDSGPIPEGRYSFPLFIAQDATMVGRGVLDTRQGIERLPPTWQFQRQTFANQAWGPDRVRLTVLHIDDPKSRNRDGFYLHDSQKGYTHGCIEVDPLFFGQLRAFVVLPLHARGGKTRLYLSVKYPSPNASTYGGTKVE